VTPSKSRPGDIRSEVLAVRAQLTEDVWSRFKLYRPDGNLITLLQALQEMHARVARIEAKLDRLLGNEYGARPEYAQGSESGGVRHRRVQIPLPAAPAGAARRRGPDLLDLDVHWSMFVPKVLRDKGFGGYEKWALCHILTALEVGPSGAFLDIGLNVGPYALLGRAFSDREVIGFEPTPDLAEVAENCGKSNGLDYTVERIALGDSNGTATLYLSDSTDSSNSLNASFRPNSFVLEVPLQTLDSYADEKELLPGVLKVDTETTEPAVLRGSRDTVLRHRPWIFCEVLAGDVGAELMEVMADWGYRWYHLDGVGPLTARDVIEGNNTDLMWLFAPEEPTAQYWELVARWRDQLDHVSVGQEVPLS